MSIAQLTQTPPLRPTMTRTFAAMMARELRVLRRSIPSTLVRVLVQPLMFVFVFCYVIPKIGAGAMVPGGRGGPSFATVLVPGLVGSSIIMQGVLAVIFPLLNELSWQRSITDRALAPLPIQLLALQKITAAGAHGLIGGLLVFPAVLFIHAKGQAPDVHVANWALFLLVMVTGSLLAASAGLLLGTLIDPQQVQVLFALVLVPMTMLGCVYYPWAAMDHIRWLQILVLINPVVYVSEGLRAALTPQTGHMPVWAFSAALVGGTIVLCWLAMRTFTRRVLT